MAKYKVLAKFAYEGRLVEPGETLDLEDSFAKEVFHSVEKLTKPSNTKEFKGKTNKK